MYHHLRRYCKFSPKVNQRISYARSKCIGKNALKRCFFQHMGGKFRSKFLSRLAYQNAANHVFEKRKDDCFRNYEILRVLIKYNGIIRNDIEENIKFYRVVRIIPQKHYVQIYKNQ